MFADGMPDGIWQHATCPVILLVGLYFVGRALYGLNGTIQELHGAIARLPPPAQLPAPPVKSPPDKPSANGCP